MTCLLYKKGGGGEGERGGGERGKEREGGVQQARGAVLDKI